MTRNEMYEILLKAKMFMTQVSDGDLIDDELIQNINRELYELKRMSVKDAVALATVIICGCFHESPIDGYWFDLPSTIECMDAFHDVKKMMNKGRKLPIYIYHEEVC